jgi:hypothetical protein
VAFVDATTTETAKAPMSVKTPLTAESFNVLQAINAETPFLLASRTRGGITIPTLNKPMVLVLNVLPTMTARTVMSVCTATANNHAVKLRTTLVQPNFLARTTTAKEVSALIVKDGGALLSPTMITITITTTELKKLKKLDPPEALTPLKKKKKNGKSMKIMPRNSLKTTLPIKVNRNRAFSPHQILAVLIPIAVKLFFATMGNVSDITVPSKNIALLKLTSAKLSDILTEAGVGAHSATLLRIAQPE